MKYFVGIDQGGTKCDIVIADEDGKIIDRYIDSGYGSVIAAVKKKPETFFKKCIEQQINYLDVLLKRHKIKSKDIYALAASSALTDHKEFTVNFEKMLPKSLKTKNIATYNDMISAWRAGANTYPGGVIGMGTGTGIMFFKDKDKPVSLTENITRQANKELGYLAFFHACNSAFHKSEPTLLSDCICEFTGTASADEAFNKAAKGGDINALQFQDFVPYVYEAYLKDDKVARGLIQAVALSISDCIRAGLNEMNLSKTPFTLVLNGGAFKGHGYIMENLIKSDLSDFTDITFIQSEYEPVYGALMLAYEKYSDRIPTISNANEFNLIRKLK